MRTAFSGVGRRSSLVLHGTEHCELTLTELLLHSRQRDTSFDSHDQQRDQREDQARRWAQETRLSQKDKHGLGAHHL